MTETTPKQQTPTRAPPLLPQGANQTIRPNQASSVSTQTANQSNQVLVAGQKNAKLRTKPPTVRPAVPNLKSDAGNQTKILSGGLQQIVTSAGNKMVVTTMNNGTQMIQQMIPKQQQQTTFLQQVSYTRKIFPFFQQLIQISI